MTVFRCRICSGEMSERLGKLTVTEDEGMYQYHPVQRWLPSLFVRYCLSCGNLCIEVEP